MTQQSFVNWWIRLTSPHPSITDIEQLRQSRLLAALLIILVPIISLTVVVNTITGTPLLGRLLTLGVIGIALYSLYANHSGKYELSANLAVGAFAFLLAFNGLILETPQSFFEWIAVVLVSTILFPPRKSLALAGLAITVLVIHVAHFPQAINVPATFPLQLFIVVSAVLFIFVRHRDGLERARQAELRISDERLQRALLSARMGAWDWDIVTRKVTWSENVVPLFGLDDGQFAGTYDAYLNLIYVEDRPAVQQTISRLLTGEAEEYEIEHRVHWADGTFHWLEGKGRLYRDDGQRPVRISGTVTNITDRKNVETTLRESEERFRLISSVTSDYTFTSRFNAEGKLENTLLTGAFETITGYAPDEFKSIGGYRATLHPDDIVEDDHVLTILHQNISAVKEVRIVKKGGEIRWIRTYAYPLWDVEHNQLTGIYGGVQDITERKRAEIALRYSETHLRALLNATIDVAFMISPDGTILTSNRVFAESMGLSVDEMVGRNVFNMLRPDLRVERRKWFEEAIRTGQLTRWVDAGTTGWWDNSIYPILSLSGSVESFAVYSKDITEWKKLTVELERHTVQLEQIVEERTAQFRRAKEQIEVILYNTSDAVALTQLNGNIQTSNPAFTAMFGDKVSTYIEYLLWAVADDKQSTVVANALVNVFCDHVYQRIETHIISGNGQNKDIDLVFIPVQLATETAQHGVLVSAHDITHLKEIERFKARFVADTLHDLASPISALSTRIYLLKRNPDKLQEHARALENQVEHLRNLLSDLRTLSQLDRAEIKLHLEMSNLNLLAVQVFDTYEPIAINKEQTLRLITDPAMVSIQLDIQMIERVLVNLVSNAIHYTPNGKTINIQTNLQPDSVLFSVADEGIGIKPEELSRIFERFYRTSEARQTRGSGTGLGLAIVKEVVELHGGTVTVTSEIGKGSTFAIQLPSKR